jgi:carbamate kinase
VRVIEAPWISDLVRRGVIVIACGGGGIPVLGGRGVEAVIDKDLASVVLALEAGASRIVDLTTVPRVQLDYGTPRACNIDRMTPLEARRHLAAGQFAPGSMEPKIRAAVRFLEAGGREFVITTPERAPDGTLIVPADES